MTNINHEAVFDWYSACAKPSKIIKQNTGCTFLYYSLKNERYLLMLGPLGHIIERYVPIKTEKDISLDRVTSMYKKTKHMEFDNIAIIKTLIIVLLILN